MSAIPDHILVEPDDLDPDELALLIEEDCKWQARRADVSWLTDNPDVIPPAKDPSPMLTGFNADELLEPIAPTRYVGGIEYLPTEGYTVVPGALSAGKTTLTMGLAAWRCSGYDVLNLDPLGRMNVEPGPTVFITYEDSATVIASKFRRVAQAAHALIASLHGPRGAAEFLQRIARHFRLLVLTGRPGTQLVVRTVHGEPCRNSEWVDELLGMIGGFARSDLLIAIDPLRLAFGGGSQNDDFGADLGVCLLNEIACRYPNSGVLVVSHTNKSAAIEQGEDRVGLAYATSGSALWSQHARSNLHVGKPKPDQLRQLAPGFLTDEEIEKRRVAAVTHARLSHGQEADTAYFAMRGGVLVPIPRDAQDESVMQKLRRALPAVADCIDRIVRDGGRASDAAIEDDRDLRRQWPRNELRRLLKQLEGQGWLVREGKTTSRRLSVTDAGKLQLPPAAAARDPS